MMHTKLSVIYLIAFLLIWPFTACKSQKSLEPSAPTEHYQDHDDVPLVSTIMIPIHITKWELNKLIDTKLAGPLYEDYSYDDQGGDEMMMNLWKNGPVEVEVFSNVIKYKIPLKYWLKKKLLIGEAESEGAFEISFRTTYTLNSDWTIHTNTITEYHTWTKAPVIKTGWGDITIQWIANLLVNRSKAEISGEIDKIFKESLNLKAMVAETWLTLQSPTLISPEYQMWMKVTPQSIATTPLYSNGEAIVAKIGLNCVADVTFGEKPSFRKNQDLPNLEVAEYINDDAFQMRVLTDITYEEAERLANLTMKGYVIEATGGKKVTVEGIHLFGNGNELVVKTKLSGAFNGNIYFTGTPVYDTLTNAITLANFNYDLETRNFLHRTANWLFSGTIKKKMQESMSFPLEENIASLRTSVQGALSNFQITQGVMLRGQLKDVKVLDTKLMQNSIRVVLFCDGKVHVDVEGF
jgi:hypothetical protein